MSMETLVKGSDQGQSPNGADAGGVPPTGEPPTFTGGGGDGPLEGVRACQECGAEMLDGQDWCLNCGTAAPGRLGNRPGWRAVATVSALTLLLVMGAVAASYAALSQDANNEVAQAPPTTATPPPGAVAQLPPAETTPTLAPAATLPTVSTPTTPLIPTTGSTPSLPSLPSLPTISTPSTSTPTTTTTATVPTTTTTATTPTTTTTATTPTTTPTLTPITLGKDAAELYDPYKHATNSTAPGNVYDGKDTTSFSVTTDPTRATMDVGLIIDLGSVKSVRQLEVHTSTPDYALEIYGADGSQIPPDILDARWQHLRSRLHVDSKAANGKVNDGIEKIKLKKATDIRHLLLWFAKPPKAGTTVTISELTISG